MAMAWTERSSILAGVGGDADEAGDDVDEGVLVGRTE